MTTDRPYRRGRSAAEAMAELERCAGSQFDPRVVATLGEVIRREAAAAATGPVAPERPATVGIKEPTPIR
jgi:HD-GYP domain-containing protein (c-di-GMP phosphodiesterase class II)